MTIEKYNNLGIIKFGTIGYEEEKKAEGLDFHFCYYFFKYFIHFCSCLISLKFFPHLLHGGIIVTLVSFQKKYSVELA
jgi:hypothetical protein